MLRRFFGKVGKAGQTSSQCAMDDHQQSFGKGKFHDINNIREHLTCLLNSRCGSVSHLPDYGLPDLADIYRELPYSTN